MTDKQRLADIERRVWELRAAIVAAADDGLAVSIRLGGQFEGGPTFFNDRFDTVTVLGTRTTQNRAAA